MTSPVLIDNAETGQKLTKQDVIDYYNAPHIRKGILAGMYGEGVLTVMQREPGKPIYRRYLAKDRPIELRTPAHMEQLTHQRTVEIHPSVGASTSVIWVDLDPGEHVDLDTTKDTVRQVHSMMRTLPDAVHTDIAFSGGRGFYVRSFLSAPMNTDKARILLASKLSPLINSDPKLTLEPPGKGQIRLDISTLHDKGSIRALYSLNAATGLASVPVKTRELEDFNPHVDADPRRLTSEKKISEFAPGIPKARVTHPLPEGSGHSWTMSVQHHNADKAGLHWDLRLVDPETSHAHSWAIPRANFPPPGERPYLAIRTPTHSAEYALNFGEGGPRVIGAGYGKGTVEIKHKEPVKVISTSPRAIKFERTLEGGSKEQYALFHTHSDKWLLKNTTRQDEPVNFAKEAFMLGYATALEKLGMSNASTSGQAGKNVSHSMSTNPLEMGDENLPAGQLASALSQLQEPSQTTNMKNEESAEDRLNRDISWSEPVTMPTDSGRQGASAVIPGAF